MKMLATLTKDKKRRITVEVEAPMLCCYGSECYGTSVAFYFNAVSVGKSNYQEYCPMLNLAILRFNNRQGFLICVPHSLE